MKKLLKLITAVMVLLCAVALSGCGSDKISGTWGRTVKNPVFEWDGNTYVQLDISKNGDKTYIIKERKYRYVLKRKHISGNFIRGNELNDITFEWTKTVDSQHSATFDDNRLSVGMFVYTYVEKDGTIINGKEVYRRDSAEDIKKFKEAEEKRLKELYEKDKIGIRYKKKNIRNLEFKDAEAK